jgi:hypothetical protein
MIKALGIGVTSLAIVFGMTARAFAGNVLPTPELDGSMMAAGLGVLAAGVLMMKSRRGSQK